MRDGFSILCKNIENELNGLLLNCPREGRGGLFTFFPKKGGGGEGLIKGRVYGILSVIHFIYFRGKRG